MRLRRSQLVHIDFMCDTNSYWKVSIKFTGVIIQTEKRGVGGMCNKKE